MSIWQTTKIFLNLFILRGKPNDIPYSKRLVLLLATILLLFKSVAYIWFVQIIASIDHNEVIKLSCFGALLVSVVWVLLLFAILRSTLFYYNFVDRFVQAASGFLAVDCLLTALFLLWLSGISLLQLPLAQGSIISIGIIIGFVLMMYWQFMVYIHLLVFSINISILKAGVFALFYILLQQNLSEVLLNIVISSQKL